MAARGGRAHPDLHCAGRAASGKGQRGLLLRSGGASWSRARSLVECGLHHRQAWRRLLRAAIVRSATYGRLACMHLLRPIESLHDCESLFHLGNSELDEISVRR